MRFALLGLIAVTTPAAADGGWRACIYAPFKYKQPIHFTHTICWIKDGKTDCTSSPISAVISSADDQITRTKIPGGTLTTTYMNAGDSCFSSHWTENLVTRFGIADQTGYFLITFDENIGGAYHEQTIRTRTVPFSRYDTANTAMHGRFFNSNELYHFSVEGGTLKLYNGCPGDHCR